MEDSVWWVSGGKKHTNWWCVLAGLVVSSKPPVSPRVRGWWSPTKTTAPSTSDHRVPAASAATAGGIWVLPDEYRNLGDDFRKNVSSFSATTGSTAKHPELRRATAFDGISHIFYMKVDTDLEVDSRPALLVFSVLQTTSEIPTGLEFRSCKRACRRCSKPTGEIMDGCDEKVTDVDGFLSSSM